MKPDDIKQQWDVDAIIDRTDYAKSAVETPRLHSKYLGYLVRVKQDLRKKESEYLRLRKVKVAYYRGELTKEELVERQWVQYQKNKPLKSEMEDILATDSDMIELQEALETLRTMVYQLESILKSIASRGWDVKTAVQWHIFTQGG
jgi:hypothetical protein